jgi:hypothetical protein
MEWVEHPDLEKHEDCTLKSNFDAKLKTSVSALNRLGCIIHSTIDG